MRRSVIAAVIALLAAAAFAGPSAASDRRADDARSEHQRIVDYWTPAHRVSAVPRDIVRDAHPNKKPTDPGKGNGKGGGKDTDGSTVTGATWTEGGDVVATTGKVFFTLDGTRYQCSGSAVQSSNHNMVVTAGHCLHDGDGGAFATNWAFYPGYDGAPDPDLGIWTATELFTTSTWAGTWETASDGWDDDAGFAIVTDGSDDPDLEGVLGGAGAAVPTIDFGLDPVGVDYFSFGYPAQGKFKGDTLTYCAGPVTDNLDDNSTWAMACDMTGGSSGGPWIRDYGNGGRVLNSLNSYGYRSLKGYMFGPVFDAGEQAAYDAANAATCSASSSTCVSIPS